MRNLPSGFWTKQPLIYSGSKPTSFFPPLSMAENHLFQPTGPPTLPGIAFGSPPLRVVGTHRVDIRCPTRAMATAWPVRRSVWVRSGARVLEDGAKNRGDAEKTLGVEKKKKKKSWAAAEVLQHESKRVFGRLEVT